MAGIGRTMIWLVFSCISCLFWLPIIIVTLAIVWGYYVYVYLINITAAGEGGNYLFVLYLHNCPYFVITEILEKPLALRSKFVLFFKRQFC